MARRLRPASAPISRGATTESPSHLAGVGDGASVLPTSSVVGVSTAGQSNSAHHDVPAGRLPVVVVCVTDRDAFDTNTDNIAIVDPSLRRILSVPRDLWDHRNGRRVNRAWAEGGFPALQDSLAAVGLHVDAGLNIRRSAVEAALDGVRVTVPVERPLVFLYPLAPQLPIEDGAKVVRFDPPSVELSGERIHQWLGARYSPRGPESDLGRIGRQQLLVRRLLEDGFDFRRLLADPDRISVSDSSVWQTLQSVDTTWSSAIVDGLIDRRIDGKAVLVRATPMMKLRRLVRRAGRPLARVVAGSMIRVWMPTCGLRTPARRVRMIAIIAVRNEERRLDGWLANVAPHVEGIVALDDGSTDRSAAILGSHPAVLDVLRAGPERTHWDETTNHRRLVQAAIDHGADWILALDADERIERTFRVRAERAIRRGAWLGLDAFALPLRELWDDPDRWRCDGIWARKRQPRLFAARRDHQFDLRPLHGAKAPMQGKRRGGWVTIDCRLYHLHMIRAEDREARRRRYEALDPDAIWQQIGYAYLTDETGLRTKRIGRRRGYDGA